jgi:hypothetical protein
MDINDWFAAELGSEDAGKVSFGGTAYDPTQVEEFARELLKLAAFAREQTTTAQVVQQPGTHRQMVHMGWTEVSTYSAEFEIDVPDGFDGDLDDLIDVDDSVFEADRVEGVPAGYSSNWLERAVFEVEDVEDRQVHLIYKIDPIVANDRDDIESSFGESVLPGRSTSASGVPGDLGGSYGNAHYPV